MPYPDSRQTFGIGQPGQLVQISGDAFELGHEIQLFAGDPRPYRSSVDQLAQHFGRRLSGLATEGRETEFPFGAEPRADDVFADAADADFRTPALFAVCFFGVSMTGCFDRLFMLYIVQTSGILRRPAGKAEFSSTKTQPCLP